MVGGEIMKVCNESLGRGIMDTFILIDVFISQVYMCHMHICIYMCHIYDKIYQILL